MTEQQMPQSTEVVVRSEILARADAESMEFSASCLIGNAIDTLIDVECNDMDFEQIRAAIVGLDCARSLVRRLSALAEKAEGGSHG